MSLRINSGFAKGFKLKIPEAKLCRPTGAILKKKIFDSFQDYHCSHFIDLCAGSGSMGFEAISRSFQSVEMVESDKRVFRFLQENSRLFKQKHGQQITFDHDNLHHKLHLQDGIKFLEKYKRDYLKNSLEFKSTNIIYFDPPYSDHDLYSRLIDSLKGWYEGILWLESDTLKGPDKNFFDLLENNLIAFRRSRFEQGSSFINCYYHLSQLC